MEYAGNVTHRKYWKKYDILHAYMGGVKLYGYSFAKSQFFPTAKEYILFNYHGGC